MFVHTHSVHWGSRLGIKCYCNWTSVTSPHSHSGRCWSGGPLRSADQPPELQLQRSHAATCAALSCLLLTLTVMVRALRVEAKILCDLTFDLYPSLLYVLLHFLLLHATSVFFPLTMTTSLPFPLSCPRADGSEQSGSADRRPEGSHGARNRNVSASDGDVRSGPVTSATLAHQPLASPA